MNVITLLFMKHDPALDPTLNPSGHNTSVPTRANRWLTLTVLCVSVFVIVVDGTITNVALPTVQRTLGASISQLQWIVDAYILVFAGLLIACGSLGDRLGRKGLLQIGMVLFAACSAMAGWATTSESLIFWRAAMGVGAALIFPATLATVVNIFTVPKERAIAISIWSATSGLAVALGPISGGFLLEHFWWGSVFFVNVPVIAVTMVLIAFFVPKSRDPHVTRFDPVGIVVSIAAVSVLTWAVIEGPHHGWLSTSSIAAFAAAIVLFVGFIAWERHSDHPMLDVRVFSNMRFSAGSISICFAFFALFGFIFMVTQYFQFVRGYGTLSAGLHTVPFAVFTATAAPLSPRFVERFGSKAVVSVGLAMMAVGFAHTTTLQPQTAYGWIVFEMFFMGFGLGLVTAPATEAIMGSLPPEKAGVGSAVNDTARELGGVLGVALVGSVFSSVYVSQLDDASILGTLPPEVAGLVRDSVGAANQIAADVPPLKTVVDNAFMNGFHSGSWVSAAVVLVGSVVALRFLPTRAADA